MTMALPQMLVTLMQDKEQQDAVRKNLDVNLERIVILAGTLPGASCKSVGVRLGTVIRLMFNVAFDSPSITKFSQIDQ